MKKLYTLFLLLATAVSAVAQQMDGLEQQTEAGSSVVQLTPNEARKLRGFTSDTNFVPKGQWIFGGTASYSTHTNKNYKLLIITDIDSDGYTVNVSPMTA
jgi:hypothetical protein